MHDKSVFGDILEVLIPLSSMAWAGEPHSPPGSFLDIDEIQVRYRVWYTQQQVGNWPRSGREFVKAATILGALLAATLWWGPAPANAATPARVQEVQQGALEQEAAPTADAEPAGDPPAGAQDEESSDVVDLHATAARLRGRVELGWRAGEGVSEGVFVVERSTNGSSWRPVKVCSMRFDPEQADYGCTDTRLTSGTTYAYRVCIAAKGTTCSNASPSQPVTVKAP